MAKKKTQDKPVQASPTPHTCGECGSAYGFCCPSYTGVPVLCRCEKDILNMKLCSQNGCGYFSQRSEPAPETVTSRWSENKFSDLITEKVVPIFKDGESRPFKLIKVSEIPPQGISYTGLPMSL